MDQAQQLSEYYSNRSRLILLQAGLQDALCKVTADEYINTTGACKIHPDIAHPSWEDLRQRIYPCMMIWQIAYMVHPFRDVWASVNPFRNSYIIKRIYVMYQIIDAIECGYIKKYQLPPEIEDKSQLDRASLADKVKIKIHFDDLGDAIKSGGVAFWCSRWVSLWVAHAKRSEKPKLGFLAPPEPVHIQGIFNETPYFREVEGSAFELQEVPAPEETGIRQVYVDSFELWQEKYRYKPTHQVLESHVEWVKKNLDTSIVFEVQPPYWMGENRPKTYKIGGEPENADVPLTTITDQAQSQQPTPNATRQSNPLGQPEETVNARNERWNNELIRRWDSGGYSKKLEVCEAIAAAEGGDYTGKYISDQTPITSAELKKRKKR